MSGSSHGPPSGTVAANLSIDVHQQQSVLEIDDEPLRAAVRAVLTRFAVSTAEISLAVLDDPAIHELNRRYLNHDCPTDVLSFVLDETDGHLEGEVIVSAETAAAEAQRLECSAVAELLLYVVHGTLHLVGLDDTTAEAVTSMRAAEREILAELGWEHPRLPPAVAKPHDPPDAVTLGGR